MNKIVSKRKSVAQLSCRRCKYYHHQGRRGGQCEQLGVSVGADWYACPL